MDELMNKMNDLLDYSMKMMNGYEAQLKMTGAKAAIDLMGVSDTRKEELKAAIFDKFVRGD